MIDYHALTLSRMCFEGKLLRTNALAAMYRIESQAWEAATPSQRNEMLDCARSASVDYTLAFSAWRAHRANCVRCQEATGQ